MNEIAEVEFETNLPLFFDSYRECRWTGSLILIDALTNATVGAAMIVGTGPTLRLGPPRSTLSARLDRKLDPSSRECRELAARVRDA
jgi:sulfate adenylyltransferase subunit 1 (EFTu-like GTPase family)